MSYILLDLIDIITENNKFITDTILSKVESNELFQSWLISAYNSFNLHNNDDKYMSKIYNSLSLDNKFNIIQNLKNISIYIMPNELDILFAIFNTPLVNNKIKQSALDLLKIRFSYFHIYKYEIKSYIKELEKQDYKEVHQYDNKIKRSKLD